MITRNNTLTITVLLGISFIVLWAASTIAAPGAAQDSTNTTTNSAATNPSELDGAKVYAWTCGSCHSERRPKERTDGDWEIIATHMKVRANLTAAQTSAVLNYLQENN